MMPITLDIPSRALILTVGPAGCGKSTFAEQHFPRTAIVSSDLCREMVSDDARNQECNRQAFALYHDWIGHRLSLSRLTVADATNLLPSARAKLRDLAGQHRTPVIVLEFNTTLDTCLRQNAGRERFVPEHVIEKHVKLSQQARIEMERESYFARYVIHPGVDYEVRIRSGVREVWGSGFDIIGDIHGCTEELLALLDLLGYRIGTLFEGEGVSYVHPDGRKLVFVGDITDRGPDSLGALRLVTLALEGGHLCVMGNHDNKLMRGLRGNKIQMGHGLAETWKQLDTHAKPGEKTTFLHMLQDLPYQVTLHVPNQRDVIVCHAGLPKRLVGKDTSEARNHAIYGEVVGTPQTGDMPRRGTEYRKDYRITQGGPMLVHGHEVVTNPVVDPNYAVFDVDTGCAFGGALTALRWPEGKFVSVPAKRTYCEK